MHILLWIVTAEDILGLYKGLSTSCDVCKGAGGHVAVVSGCVLGEVLWDGNGQPCGVLAAVLPHGSLQGQLCHIQ